MSLNEVSMDFKVENRKCGKNPVIQIAIRMVHFFDTEQAPEYRGLCYSQGGDYEGWNPHQK